MLLLEYAELGSLYEYLRIVSIDCHQIYLWAKQIAMGKEGGWEGGRRGREGGEKRERERVGREKREGEEGGRKRREGERGEKEGHGRRR